MKCNKFMGSYAYVQKAVELSDVNSHCPPWYCTFLSIPHMSDTLRVNFSRYYQTFSDIGHSPWCSHILSMRDCMAYYAEFSHSKVTCHPVIFPRSVLTRRKCLFFFFSSWSKFSASTLRDVKFQTWNADRNIMPLLLFFDVWATFLTTCFSTCFYPNMQ